MYELRTRMCCAVVRNRPTHTHIGNQYRSLIRSCSTNTRVRMLLLSPARPEQTDSNPDAIIIHPPNKKYILSDNNKCIIPPQRQTSETHERHLERFERRGFRGFSTLVAQNTTSTISSCCYPYAEFKWQIHLRCNILYKSRVSIFLLLYCVLTQVKIRFVC